VVDKTGDRRRYKRVAIEFPVICRIRGIAVLGWSVNACNQGILVESFLPLKTAIRILGILNRKQNHSLEMEFTYKKTYRAEAEIRHFHLEFSGHKRCRSLIGLLMPRIE